MSHRELIARRTNKRWTHEGGLARSQLQFSSAPREHREPGLPVCPKEFHNIVIRARGETQTSTLTVQFLSCVRTHSHARVGVSPLFMRNRSTLKGKSSLKEFVSNVCNVHPALLTSLEDRQTAHLVNSWSQLIVNNSVVWLDTM